MILYFADRKMNIIGHASTNLPGGYVIIEDLKTEEVETGVATFSCKIGFDKDTRVQLETMTDSGNYILRKNGLETEFYTIIDTEIDTKNQEIYVYAEDAGLDLINEIAGAYQATEAHTAAWYVEKWTKDSGFKIGINEIPESSTRKLSWDGESTVTERLSSIATQFGDFELSYSFETKGLAVANCYVNIHEKRGKDVGEKLYLNKDIDRIVIKKSVANLATGFSCKGGTPEGSENPITLKGYKYDDGDFYVGESTGYLYSRKASEKWGRYSWADNINPAYGGVGFIIRPYSYETTDQKTLCSHAVAELKKVCDVEVNYEVDIKKLPEGIKIGDRIDIVDDAGCLYLSSRILLLETSVTDNTQKATIGEHLIKDDGISLKVHEMAAQFSELANDADRIAKLAEVAKKEAEAAKNEAQSAQSNVVEMTSKVDAAQAAADAAAAEAALAKAASSAAESTASSASSAANTAQTMANNALAEATNAKKVATNYIGYGSNGLLIGNLTETTLGRNVLIDSTSVNIRAGETILASFSSNEITLGQHDSNAVISLCGGIGRIKQNLGSVDGETYLEFSGDRTCITGSEVASLYCEKDTTNIDGYLRRNILQAWQEDIRMTSSYRMFGTWTTSKLIVNPDFISLTSSNVDIIGALEVTGAATLKSTLSVSGTATLGRINASNVYLSGSLYVGGKSSTTDGKTGVAFGASGNITMQGSSAPTLNFIAGTATKSQASIKGDSSGVLTLGGVGLLLPNAYQLLGKDVDGNVLEVFRLGGSSGEPILIVGDGVRSGGKGYTNICGSSAVKFLTKSERIVVQDVGNSTYTAHFRPNSNGKCTLGHASYKWHTVYASNASINTSDRREKENIMPLGKNIAVIEEDGEKKTVDIHSALFDKLQPVQYNFINGNGRICYGLIAQDIVEAMRELEIGENELDLVHHDFWNDEETGETTETFGLAYNNLIAMLIHEVQKLKAEVATLKTA